MTAALHECLDCGHTWGHEPITRTNNPRPQTQDGTVFDLLRDGWDWHAELMRRGWTPQRQHGGDTYWVRPGKDPRDGHSAVLHGQDGPLVVFTTSIDTAWTQAGTLTRDGSGWSFGPFGFYAATEHGGDRSAAARGLYDRYGIERGDDLSDLLASPGEPGLVSNDDDEVGDWDRRDLVELAKRMIEGDYEPERPVYLEVTDGMPLFYRGRIHSIFGPPGGGKTWVGLYALAERLQAGERCAMFDWEDAEQGTTQRLLQLGCTLDDLARFDYRNPTSSLLYGWKQIETDPTPWTMIVIDSAGEALAAQGVELNDDKGTAQWFQLAKKLARRPEKPSIVMLDHVPKNAGDEPAKMAIGSQRKLAAITGASYRCDTLVEPARGKDGKLKLVTAKDRLGNRPKGSTACEVHLHDDGPLLVLTFTRSEAQAAHERGEKFRPTHLMERVSRWLEINPGATRRAIEKDVTGKTEAIRTAVEVLIEEGWMVVEKVGTAHEHRIVKDYREAFDMVSDPVDNPGTGQVRPCAPSAPQVRPGAQSTNPKSSAPPCAPSVIETGRRGALDEVDRSKDDDNCAPGAQACGNPSTNPRPATLEEYGL